MSVLITGGAGYIGSHTCIELQNAGYDVIVVDNLLNSSREALKRVEMITGKHVKFYQNDLRERKALDRIFNENKIDAVIHLAGFKAVGESVDNPIKYYSNNIASAICLFEAMKQAEVKKLVFSSSATVYSVDNEMPLCEDMPLCAISPYAETKVMIERILTDLCASDNQWSVAILRYFNPIGAHESGLIGENPKGVPNNLMPYISQVAVGNLKKLRIFGNNYNTPDGTCIRDYIHVVDLALGHIKALDWVSQTRDCQAFNLGTGKGTGVLQLRDAFVKATGANVPYVIAPRRSGDPEILCADVKKAQNLLGWTAKFDLKRMCKDTWRWQKNNPFGY